MSDTANSTEGQAPSAAPVPPAPPVPPYAQPSYGTQPPAPPAYGTQPPAPGYAAPAYPPQGYGQNYGQGYAPNVRTNTLAIVALVASIAGLSLIPFIGSLVGTITGHMALKQIRTSGEAGRGIALAGTIVGWVGLGFYILVFGFILLSWIFVAAAGIGYSSI